MTQQPILQGKGLVKRYGRVTALDHADFELYPGEVLAVIGDNGAGKSTMIKAVSGAPALSIADNMFMGREIRKPGLAGSLFRKLDRKEMERQARDKLSELGLMTIQNINQAVETLSGGQRQGVAVARAAAFGSKVIILDVISHNMPHVFEVADRIHIHRLGKRLCVIDPKAYTMSDAVAFMTGAAEPPSEPEAA